MESRTASYGRETYNEPKSFSPTPSKIGVYPPPEYQSGRKTPQAQSPFHPMVETTPLQQSVSQPISDLDLERALQPGDVLRSADINSITNLEIRPSRRLESHFGTDLTLRRGVIYAAVDRTVQAMLGEA